MIENKTLDFKFEIKQLDEDGTIEGYGSVFGNRDRHSDIIERGSFVNTLIEKPANKIKMLWQHSSSQPIGNWLEMREDDKGLYCKGKLLLTIPKGREVYEMLKAGLIDGLSIGYNAVKSKREEEDEDGCVTRRISEIDLWEISIVTFPSNVLASVTSVKSVSHSLSLPIASKDKTWSKTETDKRIREITGSKDKPSDSYKNYFMDYDVADKENFGAYKFPFVDIIDGKMHIIPRAIFDIANDVDIPTDRKEVIKEKVNALYKRFRMRFEDDTLISPFEDKKSIIENWELKEFDKFLKNSSLTNSEIKIFRKRYLELHSKEELDEKDLVKTKEQDVDDKKNKKSPEEIKNDKKSPVGIVEEKKESPEEKKLNAQKKDILESILKNLQKI